MKKYIGALLISLATLSSNAYAGSGKAIIPHWVTDPNQYTAIYISNISSHDLTVTVTFYKQDGTTASASSYTNFQASNTEITTHKTGTVVIGTTSPTYTGYAIIEWSNKGTDDDAVGLVAHGYRDIQSNRMFSISINNGQPF